MVHVIENRSLVMLTPLSMPEGGPSPGWVTCRARVDEASEVEGYPNLLGATLPREVDALVPEAQAGSLVVDRPVQLIACLVGPGRLRVEATGPGNDTG